MISDRLVAGIAAVVVLLLLSVFLGFGIAALSLTFDEQDPNSDTSGLPATE